MRCLYDAWQKYDIYVSLITHFLSIGENRETNSKYIYSRLFVICFFSVYRIENQTAILTCLHKTLLFSCDQVYLTQSLFKRFYHGVLFRVSFDRRLKTSILPRTVPTFVTAHTFCASQEDTRVSCGWCLLIQRNFCAV